jgi:hypothetical protein
VDILINAQEIFTSIIYNNDNFVPNTPGSIKLFIQELLYDSVAQRKQQNQLVPDSEINFNVGIIWPSLQIIIDTLNNTNDYFKFCHGELFLQPFNDLSTTSLSYKADGVIKFGEAEILLLEVSGLYGDTDKPRQACDHVKGALVLYPCLITWFLYFDMPTSSS